MIKKLNTMQIIREFSSHSQRQYISPAVRSCVLIKPRPKKSFSRPLRRASKVVRGASDPGKKKAKGSEKKPPDLGEALVTECPYEAVGENFFGRGLIGTQERTD